MTKEFIAKLLKIAGPPVSLLLFVSLLSYRTVYSFTAGVTQDQIKIIESNLSRERQKYEKFDSREKDLLGQVSELEKDVTKKREGIDALRKKIRLAKKKTRKLQEEQDHLKQCLSATEIKAAKRLVALYKYARKGYIKTLVNVIELEQLLQRVKYLRAISTEDRKELTKLAEEALKYKKSILQIKKEIADKETEEKKENAKLAVLREDLEKMVIRLMRIHKEKEFYETAVRELQLAALDLKQAFSKIEKKKEYKENFSSHFADSQHRLPFPFEGEVIRGDKLIGSKSLNFDKGVFIEGSDSEVKAVFPGRVDFSGRLKGYGELVIINHGSRYFTISAQLSKRMKEEGEKVESGETIGLVKPNGFSKKARVYFEIRKAGKSLDPLSWLEKH